MTAKLRYDGQWTDIPGKPKQWAVLSHFIDQQGADRWHSSFGLIGLIELGIVK